MTDDLVKRLRKQSSAGRVNHVSKADRLAAADRIEELEAKLAKAVEALKSYGGVMPVAFTPIQDGGYKARATLAELTGGKDD